jgi:hypothetical protein
MWHSLRKKQKQKKNLSIDTLDVDMWLDLNVRF